MEWPAMWIKEEVDGRPISELEYGLLCESFNSGSHMDIENSLSMDLCIVENFLQEPSLYSKKFKKNMDWEVIQEVKAEALKQKTLLPWSHPITQYVHIQSLDYAALGQLLVRIHFLEHF